MTPFYADLKRICETTNWEAGSYVQNQNQYFQGNNQLKDENKYEERNTKYNDTNTTTWKNDFCDTNTTTWANIWKIANSVQIKEHEDIASKLYLSWLEGNVMIIARNCKKE